MPATVTADSFGIETALDDSFSLTTGSVGSSAVVLVSKSAVGNKSVAETQFPPANESRPNIAFDGADFALTASVDGFKVDSDSLVDDIAAESSAS